MVYGPGWDLGAAQAPLVGGDGVGRLGERLHQQAGGRQGGARRVEEEQRAPVALALEVGVDAVEVGGGHCRTLMGVSLHRVATDTAFEEVDCVVDPRLEFACEALWGHVLRESTSHAAR